ncbi:ATP-binding protein [Streptomyces sp. NPDC002730]|uniref:ATP-binding protein n=1 Tax=Streptomyces sp. NPDC002730 TaxID=3364662 RepID=UPI0036C05E8F
MRPFTTRLLAVPKAVPILRHTLREHLGRPCADLQLCAGELLSNVITHLGEGAPVTVHLARTPDGRTRLEVTDPDPRAWPVLRHATEDDESGRGLALLAALAIRWGITQGPHTKTIWCELREP